MDMICTLTIRSTSCGPGPREPAVSAGGGSVRDVCQWRLGSSLAFHQGLGVSFTNGMPVSGRVPALRSLMPWTIKLLIVTGDALQFG
ncbi:uncharacterized protein EI90DRAFT_3086484 [Cantharellus anzutake]|uniref:uncharacterized protein n=1 Tax=Cantharellus anzutake TaxID=1750568 RepID=UPI001904534D|nr:uncharacterized protein EI90DRAFT_3086484 [Cantharellus anzutake]KAF8316449.1 hypothetical protein EI90DRAFT_3086484 [Cantharellus anzutake]